MAYTNVWSKLAPLGSQAANLIDDDFRSLKLDISERFTSIFGTADLDGLDPVAPLFIKLTGAAASKILPGATSLSLRNNADSADNILINDNGGIFTRNFIEMTVAAAIAYLKLQSNGGSGVDWRVESRTDGKLVLRSVTGGVDALVLNSGTLSSPWTINFSNGLTVTSGGINITGTSLFTGAVTFTGGTATFSNGLTASATVTINIASGTSLLSNSTNNVAADINQFVFQRGGVNKWRIGVNISGTNTDDYNVYSDGLGAVVLSANSSGRVAIGSSSVTGTVSLDIDSGLAAGSATVRFLRGGVQKFRLGGDGSDNFSIFDATGATINATVTVNGDINARTGYAIGGAAANGNYLRGNGTRFVSSALLAGDLPTTLTPTILTVGGGQNITRILSNSAAWNPGTVNSGTQTATTITVTGAQVGDDVIASNIWLADNVFAIMQAWVSALNTVTVQITNHTGGTITLTNRTIKVWVIG